MAGKDFERVKKALSEVRDFYAGKGGKLKFHIPVGKGEFIVREMTVDEWAAMLPTDKEHGDGRG